MKSSREIPPRVGMQVRFCNPGWLPKSFKVSRLAGETGFYDSYDNLETCGYAWEVGVYEITWTPPADDERRLFMEAAKWREKDELYDHNPELCAAALALGEKHSHCRRGAGVDILESLALDGADYDDMPDFEETKR